MPLNSEFAVELLFDKKSDGRFHVHSPSVPGFHLAGRDLDAMRADIEPIMKDLLFHNAKVIVDTIRWVPSLDDIVKNMAPPPTPPELTPGKPSFLLIVGHAA